MTAADDPLVMPRDEFALVRKLADATKACGCGPLEPCKAHMDPEPSRMQQDAATARTLLSGALLEEVARRVGEYENAITWNTSCASCARVLDSAYAETVRREQAEETLAAERRAFHGTLIRFAAEAVRGTYAYGLDEVPASEALRRIGVDLKKAADEMAAANLREKESRG